MGKVEEVGVEKDGVTPKYSKDVNRLTELRRYGASRRCAQKVNGGLRGPKRSFELKAWHLPDWLHLLFITFLGSCNVA